LPSNAPTRQYLEIPLQIPAGGTPSGEATPTRLTIFRRRPGRRRRANTCSSGIQPTPGIRRVTRATCSSTRMS
jgi:hypothetical protein